ncbi:MAG: S8/S53 family peptidase [Ignavibacteriaceae bacterium]
MKKKKVYQSSAFSAIFILILFSTFVFASPSGGKKGPEQYKYLPGSLVVKLKKQPTGLMKSRLDVEAVLSNLQMKYGIQSTSKAFETAKLKKRIGIEELERVFIMNVPAPTDLESLARNLEQDPLVEYAEPQYIIPINKAPNDQYYNGPQYQQYQLPLVKADSAWGVSVGDSSVVIGMIDTGVDWDHPDLAASIWTNTKEIPSNGIDDDGNGYIDDVRGWDFVTGITTVYPGEDGDKPDNNPMDFDGHGTHTAGIAGATTNNGIGIASLSWGAKIMPLRVGWHDINGGGYGLSTWMGDAFIYATNNGVSVANLSMGTSKAVLEGALYAYKNGVVICNAAGNTGSDFVSLLGAQPWSLAVAATNSNDSKASYSSYGNGIDICAPGGDLASGNKRGILSSIVYPSPFYSNANYIEFEGTSMASPMVAALAALVKSKNPTWTPALIMFQICGTADNIDGKNSGYGGKLGYGRINAYRALTETPPPPKPKLQFISVTVDDSQGGNSNGILEPGETAKIIVEVRNEWGDAVNVMGSLSTSHWTTTVQTNNISFGSIKGITDLDYSSASNLNNPFIVSVNPEAIPSIVPFIITLTDGAYSTTFTFKLSVGAHLLLVADDEGFGSETSYAEALDVLGVSYDVWDHSKKGTPPATVLMRYNTVVWMCEWAFPSLDSLDRSSLKQYLDSGGKLFLSGQDIGWDLSAPSPNYANEYVVSKGVSKTFYETYLKSSYIADDAGISTLTGVPGDTLGDGLSFTRFQPGRAAQEQIPDVINPIGGSVPVFKYNEGSYAGSAGAIRYSGSYKLVNFAFGGFESITDLKTRIEVMKRILNWFDGQEIVVDSLLDTENRSSSFPIHARVNGSAPLLSMDLFWDTDGEFPFKKIVMTNEGGSLFRADIPAQNVNTNVEYFVLARTASGYLPYIPNVFTIGADIIPPTIVIADTIRNSIKLKGPYSFTAQFTDNIGIDTSSLILHYDVNGGSASSTRFDKMPIGDYYVASLVPSSSFVSGDTVSYYITANDVAAAKNQSRYPVTGSLRFTVGREFVDDFEKQTTNVWDFGRFDRWGYSSKYRHGGSQDITDSPVGNYSPNSNKSLTLKKSYDLTHHTKVELQFFAKVFVDPTDTVYIEATRNGIEWTAIKTLTGIDNAFGGPAKYTARFDAFTGAGSDSIRVRFRLKSDGANQEDGIYLDDIEIVTGSIVTSVKDQEYKQAIPSAYVLEQNYPNPFNPATTINYQLPKSGNVTLKIFDMLGNEVMTLVNGQKEIGKYTVQFDASSLASGMYVYQLRVNDYTSTKKMLLLK